MLATKEASLLATKDANTFVNIIKQSASQLFDDDPFMKASFKISLHPDKVDKYRNKNRSSVKIDSDHVPHHVYYRPKIKEPSKIVDEEVFEILYEWIPMRYRITDPVLLFSSNTDGYSFKTLFKKVEDQEPTLLFIKTADGNVRVSVVGNVLVLRPQANSRAPYRRLERTFPASGNREYLEQERCSCSS
jgi:hypothetical protein